MLELAKQRGKSVPIELNIIRIKAVISLPKSAPREQFRFQLLLNLPYQFVKI